MRMIDMLKSSDDRNFFLLSIGLLISADVAILLNIPFLRQILGFFFLTVLPGLLILQALKLNKIGSIEKLVLTVGLSISFLMFFGLFINNLLPSLGYETPLSTISLLLSFNIAFIVFAIIACRTNKDKVFSLPNLNLTASEKAFLIVPILFPALSIFGMHVMNTADNNIILIFLLFLIPIYVVFVCLFNQKFPKRLYPAVIFLISISLLLLLSLRSNHIIGTDTHQEFYLFQTTLDNLHWRVLTVGNALDACLVISILPTIYKSILNISPEFLFKILYSLIYSVSPLVIYVISKKYVGEGYAFLASCFFMFQATFLLTASNARTNTAILFFALAMMTLFSDRIDPLKKRILFIVFMASCMVSHYATAYIFFFVMIGTLIGVEILLKKFTFKKMMSLTIVVLFFALIFFWYSQVTETGFTAGVSFVEKTLNNLNRFFIAESRAEDYKQLVGLEPINPILSRVNLVFTWGTFIFIGIGVLTMIKRYKEMVSISNVKHKKPDFLKTKFEMEYLIIVLMCVGLVVIMVALPHLSKGYDIYRLYSLAIVILSVCFIIGGMSLSKHFLSKERTCAKKETLFASKSVGSENGSEIRAYLIILLILIPYCMLTIGPIYQLFGASCTITLNSEGEQYDIKYVHDQESYGAKWLKISTYDKAKIYANQYGSKRLLSQGGIHSRYAAFIEDKKAIKKGYIYLRYYNVVDGKLVGLQGHTYNMTEYSDILNEMSKVYANGGSEVWKK